MPAAPARAVRVPDETWLPALARAAAESRPIDDVITAALAAYAAAQPARPGADCAHPGTGYKGRCKSCGGYQITRPPRN